MRARQLLPIAAALLCVPAAVQAPARAAAAPAAQPASAAQQAASSTVPLYLDTSHPFAERAADLVSRMTLAEKVAQLHTNSAPAIPRLGVQQYTYWSEGQHGINLLGGNSSAGGVTGGVHATSFPTNQASSMAWDPDLVYREATAISDEARGFVDKSLFGKAQNNLGPDPKAYGMLTYWAPTVNLDRDPRWGRTDEAFGEDPLLVSRIAGAFVNGYQGQTPSGAATSPYLKVAATAKHYALNNSEFNRHSGSADTTDANIRDYYTRQFAHLIEDSHVAGLMTSYNAVNGTPVPANTYLTNLLAQRTYGFDGYTTSDCGAVGDVYQADRHHWAPPGWTITAGSAGEDVWVNTKSGRRVSAAAGGQAFALRAGTQLNCTGSEFTLENVTEAIDAGILTESVLDGALIHVFTTRMETGEFDPAGSVPWTKITKDVIESPEHQALAAEVARKSLVLLKNDAPAKATKPLLPVDPASAKRVVVVGDLAAKVTLGGYSGEPTHTVNAVQGINALLHGVNPSASVRFDACATSTTATDPAACSDATIAAMKTADLVLVMAGTDQNVAREEQDSKTIAMPGNYRSLIDTVIAAGNPRTVLALQAHGPLGIEDVRAKIPAIVFSGYNGQSQGAALADVLFGRTNPGGHLNFTWYTDDSQLPDINNYGLTPAQTGGLGRTYQYFTGKPTFPFGYGLSYTTFGFSDLRMDRRTATGDNTVTVSLLVTNTGAVAGDTVAQLYATTPAIAKASQEAPKQRLAGFAKTAVLRPGQAQRVKIAVPLSELSVWSEATARQVVPTGGWQLAVGPDSQTAALRGQLWVSADATPKLQTVTLQPGRVSFAPGDRLDLTGANPWIVDDTTDAEHHVTATRIVEAVKSDQSFADLTKAKITYASSNPTVATVTADGKVTMLASGVSTLSATVNGLTGSVAIFVKEPFTFTGPSIVEAGQAFTVTATLPHPAGAAPLSDAKVTLRTPSGWTVKATTPTTADAVPAGKTVTVSWQVTPPAGVASGTYPFAAQATFADPNGSHTVSETLQVAVPYPSFVSAYNNVGQSEDGTDPADIDGNRASYSAQTLAAATPALTPGATFVHDGLTFTWPASTIGTPDNVKAVGQAITVSGSGPASGSKLGFIGTGVYGTAGGTATIVYTDGSTQDVKIAITDWWSNTAPPGGDIVATLPYLNIAGGRLTQNVSLYYASVPLTPGKTVKYVHLPNVNDGVMPGNGLHLFTMAIG